MKSSVHTAAVLRCMLVASALFHVGALTSDSGSLHTHRKLRSAAGPVENEAEFDFKYGPSASSGPKYHKRMSALAIQAQPEQDLAIQETLSLDLEGTGLSNSQTDLRELHMGSNPPQSLDDASAAAKSAASAAAKSRTVMASISVIDALLVLLACWAMYSAYTHLGSRFDVFLGATTTLQVAVFLGYISLATGHGFLQQRSGTTGYSFIAATIMIWIAKCLVSFAMFAGKNDVKTGLATLFAPGCSRCGKAPAFVLPMVPGFLLAAYDALSFSSLTALDPATYQILQFSKIFVVCFLWSVMFQRKLSENQWLVFVLLFAACITRSLDRIQVIGTGVHTGIMTVVAQVSISAFASVFSEVLLKEMPMPTDLNNFCTYFWGLLGLMMTLLYQHGADGLYTEWLSPASWAKLQGDPWMMASIACLTTYGIVTAYLIKELSNIVKELSRGFVIIACAGLDMFLVGSSARTPAGIAGVVLAILGICLYSIEPLRNQAVEAPRKDKS